MLLKAIQDDRWKKQEGKDDGDGKAGAASAFV